MAKTAYAFPAKRLKATTNEPLFKAFNHLGEFSNMKNEILQAMSKKIADTAKPRKVSTISMWKFLFAALSITNYIDIFHLRAKTTKKNAFKALRRERYFTSIFIQSSTEGRKFFGITGWPADKTSSSDIIFSAKNSQ